MVGIIATLIEDTNPLVDENTQASHNFSPVTKGLKSHKVPGQINVAPC